MQIRDIANKLNASVLTPDLDMSREVVHAFSSDLMSDVLTGDHYKTGKRHTCKSTLCDGSPGQTAPGRSGRLLGFIGRIKLSH